MAEDKIKRSGLEKELTKIASSIDRLIEAIEKDEKESRSVKTAGLKDSLDIGKISNIPSGSGNSLLDFILS